MVHGSVISGFWRKIWGRPQATLRPHHGRFFCHGAFCVCDFQCWGCRPGCQPQRGSAQIKGYESSVDGRPRPRRRASRRCPWSAGTVSLSGGGLCPISVETGVASCYPGPETQTTFIARLGRGRKTTVWITLYFRTTYASLDSLSPLGGGRKAEATHGPPCRGTEIRIPRSSLQAGVSNTGLQACPKLLEC
jgi:hypothetical protein